MDTKLFLELSRLSKLPKEFFVMLESITYAINKLDTREFLCDPEVQDALKKLKNVHFESMMFYMNQIETNTEFDEQNNTFTVIDKN